MASSGISSAPASSVADRYDVFLSFQGEDAQNQFISHLYMALAEKGIKTFKDDKMLDKGAAISPALFEAIGKSRFCIVVISKGYASSPWCLDELKKITDTKTGTVFPVFYNIDPYEVRKQTGSFGKAFSELEKNFYGDMEKVQGWRSALTNVGNMSGWVAANYRDEALLVDDIVLHILKKLNGIEGGLDSCAKEVDNQ
ncbi:hypothetical protein JCGZ_08515 [Jatropha curcas]|uniref:TIR domain-containing protein n=1 Tax=Jatropha curcas TaxID=180498 RepID=A0A067LGR3_JATCU|nr:toll/interleukin-1 receptor-like protein [Jatropha curcas]KDP46543.1 hypothetical protein JCGZ_08515 [Jatropha curcas]